MELNPDLQEFLRSFVGHDVRFLIVGGYALAAHGHPRYTKDLDVWVWTDPSNAERVVRALEDFDVGGLQVPFISVNDLRTNNSLPAGSGTWPTQRISLRSMSVLAKSGK
jgi:hypothetical protein